jgi:tetratricopeptide (TPR) repeat protein
MLEFLPDGIEAAQRIENQTKEIHDYQQASELALNYGHLRLYTQKATDPHDMQHTEETLQLALRMADKADDQLNQERAYFLLGHLALIRLDPTAAEESFQKCLNLRLQVLDQEEWTIDHNTFCQIVRSADCCKVAQCYYEKALAIDLDKKNLRGEGVNQFSLGQLSLFEGKTDESIIHLQRTLEIAQQFPYNPALGPIHSCLGLAFLESNHLDIAKVNLIENLKISKKLGSQRAISWALCQLGNVEQAQDKVEVAKSFYRQALRLAKAVGDQICESIVLYHLAEIADAEGLREDEEKYLRHSLALSKEAQNGHGMAKASFSLGRLLLQKSSTYEEGCCLLKEAQNMCIQMGFDTEAQTITLF